MRGAKARLWESFSRAIASPPACTMRLSGMQVPCSTLDDKRKARFRSVVVDQDCDFQLSFNLLLELMDMVKISSCSSSPGFLRPRAPISFRNCSSGALQLQCFKCNVAFLQNKVREEPRHGALEKRRRMLQVCASAISDVDSGAPNPGAARVSPAAETSEQVNEEGEDAPVEEDRPLTPEEKEDQECVDQIVKVLDLLKKNRDMTPNEVRLIVMIEDPRESEGLGMLNEDGEWTSLRDEIANAVIDISEGRVPKDREVLRALRDELLSWPNLEQSAERSDPRKSLYAGITDTGIDPVVAGERANVDWDAAAADIAPEQQKQANAEESTSMPPALGYSVLYFVSFIPVLIGITVVAILYFNSFQ